MLIARSDTVQLPNNPPEWTSTPSGVTSQAGTGGVYPFAQNLFDQEGDVLTVSLNSGSTALEAWMSIVNNTLVMSSGAVEGSYLDYIMDVKDADSGLIASNPFPVVISEAPPQTSPSLFTDYGANAFAGEAGALAVNDAWASTVYDYFPQFAPTISTLPTPTTGASLPTSNGVNPNAADEFCVFDRAGLVTALNNATYQFIFIASGSDCTDGSDNDELTLTISGSSGSERWFIYWDEATPSNVQDIKPWNQAQVDRVNMPFITHDVGAYTHWVGLSWGIISSQQMRMAILESGSNNNLWYRCNCENAVSHAWMNRANDNTVYQCVSHDHTAGTSDIHCFVHLGGDTPKVISCEGWDYMGDFFHIEQAGTDGAIIEDCDIYRKTFYDGNGNIDPNGNYGKGEGAIDCKNLNPSQSSTFKVYGNRIWAMRVLDPTTQPGGGSGAVIRFSPPTNFTKDLMDCRWNVIFDCSDTGINLKSISLSASDNHSVVRNILYDIRTNDSQDSVFNMPQQTTEVYLNTVANCLSSTFLHRYFRSDSSDVEVHDCMGNFYQDVTTVTDQSLWGTTNFKFGYNAWAGTYTKATKQYASDYEAPSKAALNMGDFTFKRKKMTGVENHTIPGIVPTTSTPSAFRTLVPTSGGDQIGSRSGIGVDDTF